MRLLFFTNRGRMFVDRSFFGAVANVHAEVVGAGH